MLLALRRLFGISAAVSDEETESRDWRSRKWVIEPVRLGFFARLEEVWRYRRILWFFAVSSVKERYEGMTLGIFWLFARPVVPLLISTAVFGGLLKVPSDGVPYVLFFLAGMSCWRIFERSMLWVSKSLDASKGLIKKVYFPRVIAPVASVSPAILEFGVVLALLLVVCLIYFLKDGVMYLRVGPQMLVGFAAVGMTVFFAISLGLWTSVLQVRHKDVQYSLRYVLQFWHYLTPVIYPMSTLPKEYQFIIYVNPMASLVETYKWAMLGLGQFPTIPLLSGTALILVTFGTGLIFFHRSEAVAVDKL